MADFNIMLEDKEFRLYIRRISRNVKRRNLILMAARTISARSAEERFRDGGSPPYTWPALAESTIRQRIAQGTWPGEGGSQPILRRFGSLKEAILDTSGSRHGAFFRKLGVDAIEFGTDFVGAQRLQRGDAGQNLPARPFHYWSEKDVRDISTFASSFMFSENNPRRAVFSA